jgi:hypothetical protein
VTNHERGFALLEPAIAAAVVAIGAAGALYALAAFGRFSTHETGAVRTAATVVAEQTLRVAQNVWKYGSPGNAPTGNATVSVPVAVPGAAPAMVPMTIVTTITPAGASQSQIAVTVSYTPDAFHTGDAGSVSVSGIASVKAPLPGSKLRDPSPVPAPSGAP